MYLPIQFLSSLTWSIEFIHFVGCIWQWCNWSIMLGKWELGNYKWWFLVKDGKTRILKILDWLANVYMHLGLRIRIMVLNWNADSNWKEFNSSYKSDSCFLVINMLAFFLDFEKDLGLIRNMVFCLKFCYIVIWTIVLAFLGFG